MKRLLFALTAGLFAVMATPLVRAGGAQTLDDAIAYVETKCFGRDKVISHNIAEKTVASSDYTKFWKDVPDNTVMIPVQFVHESRMDEGEFFDTFRVTTVAFFFQDGFNALHYWFPPNQLGLTKTEIVKQEPNPSCQQSNF